ncbi:MULTISPECIES: helix-turn-helix transcriptional regulator [unclassified Paenibacillus]|uniref:helix-turn-helix transcriptional regulator n=1 Tax=unclassified Paenibacillus TaxID=185978 RepID=UPI00083874C8|nr:MULTISPECIES: AraC family transcriptional regulator [unclassified Paenibacillus]NWL87889.1 AraC family transcriptional regulator [Paenibacillus sp. 79R4]
MSSPLEVFSDLSERLHYNRPDFPLYVHKDQLLRYGYAAACHWHPDLEFIYVLDGAMDFFVNGRIVHLEAHQGIFVNSKRMHYGFSADRADCTFIAVVIHPVLLSENSQPVKVYLDEKFGLETENFILMTPRIDWQQEALVLLRQIYDEMFSDTCNPLRLLAQAVLLCANVGEHIQQAATYGANDQAQTLVWKMTGFIHQHYDRKITLDDIAASGAVCRSRCCELFNKYIGQTPNTYLMNYRIAKSYDLLCETNRTICEIALTCGFQTASYFSYVFRRETGLTPQNYRKQLLSAL